MIQIDDIGVRKRDDHARAAVIVTADLHLAAAMMVDRYALMHAPATILNLTEERVRYEIWHKLYGDLVRPMSELTCEVMRASTPYGRLTRAEELCSQLNGKLRFPTR
jgi:hypothetical protein